jgi:hypothetical protein
MAAARETIAAQNSGLSSKARSRSNMSDGAGAMGLFAAMKITGI